MRQQTEKERLVTQIAHHIRRSLNLEEVLVTTVTEVRQFLGCDRVLIYRFLDNGTGKAINESVLPNFPKVLGRSFPDEVFPREYHQAYTLGKTLAITNLETAEIPACLVQFLQQLSVKAKLVVPILQGEHLWGLLIAHNCSQPRMWQALEIELMKQLATQVAIAIQQSELYEKLQQLNTDLELRVQQRTEELAQANSSLSHTNQTLQALIAASPRAIFTLDLAGKIKLWNPAAERMFGWSEAEVLDRPNPLISPDKQAAYQTLFDQVLQGETLPTIESRPQRKNGSPIDISFSAAPLKDSQGQITGIVIVVADITDRKLAEKVLRQSEERFRSLIENALDIITILDLEGTIYYISKSVAKVLEYSHTELIETNIFAYIHPDDIAKVSQTFSHALTNSDPPRLIEFRCRHQSGAWLIFEAISQRFIDHESAPRIVVNSRDVTERKRMEEICLALEREKELSTLKTRFFSMASHEFRTPLSSILAAAQILERAGDKWSEKEKRERNLQRIQSSVKNMIQLLDDILTINRAETGNLDFNPHDLNLQEFCRLLVEEIRLSASTPRHTLTFIHQGQCTHAYLDERLLRSIITNLLSNAIKYSPHGGSIEFHLECNDQDALLQIKDQGIGISIDTQNKLFEPFIRGENVRNIPGTGLGLVVVKKCVELHGGTITVTSEVGVGTTWLVTLPLVLSPQNHLTTPTSQI